MLVGILSHLTAKCDTYRNDKDIVIILVLCF
jgi:hypothetical protein